VLYEGIPARGSSFAVRKHCFFAVVTTGVIPGRVGNVSVASETFARLAKCCSIVISAAFAYPG
jgi:hypothetical protein